MILVLLQYIKLIAKLFLQAGVHWPNVQSTDDVLPSPSIGLKKEMENGCLIKYSIKLKHGAQEVEKF